MMAIAVRQTEKMPIDSKRYPDNWNSLALSVKEAAGWRCQCCNRFCYKPGSRPKGITRSQLSADILQVHHRNHLPEDNRRENLLAVCPACHLAMHRGGHGNASPGQLSLF